MPTYTAEPQLTFHTESSSGGVRRGTDNDFSTILTIIRQKLASLQRGNSLKRIDSIVYRGSSARKNHDQQIQFRKFRNLELLGRNVSRVK